MKNKLHSECVQQSEILKVTTGRYKRDKMVYLN